MSRHRTSLHAGRCLSDLAEPELTRRIRDLAEDESGTLLTLDDAASIGCTNSKSETWVTTDPSPIPCLVHRLGMGDYSHSGWLLAARSFSDLAAVGAKPVALAIAVEFPASLRLLDFDQFFKGILNCSRAHGARLVGGNIKQTTRLEHAVAFATGMTPHGKSMKRGNPRDGDRIFVVSRRGLGAFWAGVAAARYTSTDDETQWSATKQQLIISALQPTPPVSEGWIIADKAKPWFCMDTSDGLITCALELSRVSGFGINIDLAREAVIPTHIAKTALAIGADPYVWGVAWGDLNLFCCASLESFTKVRELLAAADAQVAEIGSVTSKSTGISITLPGGTTNCIPEWLTGEQFGSHAVEESDISDYLRRMMTFSLLSE